MRGELRWQLWACGKSSRGKRKKRRKTVEEEEEEAERSSGPGTRT